MAASLSSSTPQCIFFERYYSNVRRTYLDEPVEHNSLQPIFKKFISESDVASKKIVDAEVSWELSPGQEGINYVPFFPYETMQKVCSLVGKMFGFTIEVTYAHELAETIAARSCEPSSTLGIVISDEENQHYSALVCHQTAAGTPVLFSFDSYEVLSRSDLVIGDETLKKFLVTNSDLPQKDICSCALYALHFTTNAVQRIRSMDDEELHRMVKTMQETEFGDEVSYPLSWLPGKQSIEHDFEDTMTFDLTEGKDTPLSAFFAKHHGEVEMKYTATAMLAAEDGSTSSLEKAGSFSKTWNLYLRNMGMMLVSMLEEAEEVDQAA